MRPRRRRPATLGGHGTTTRTSAARAARPHHREELRDGLAVLGYEDGDCASVDGTDAIARTVAQIDPNVIVTFGPDGMTGHPDHRAVSRRTTQAWALSRSAARLWYAR